MTREQAVERVRQIVGITRPDEWAYTDAVVNAMLEVQNETARKCEDIADRTNTVTDHDGYIATQIMREIRSAFPEAFTEPQS